MTALPISLLLVAIANIVYKTIQVQRRCDLERTWVAAVIVAAILIELADYLSKTSRFGHDIPHLELRLWFPRLVLVGVLAVLRVDADVVQAVTDSNHREAFGLAIRQEQSTLCGIETAWLHDPSITRADYSLVVAREKSLANALQYIDAARDVEDLARVLDAGSVPALVSLGPVGGYESIVTMKLKIGSEQHLREWSSRGVDLCIQILLLLFPYAIGSIAFRAFKKRSSHAGRRPGPGFWRLR